MKKKILYAIVFAAAIITGYSAYNEYGRTKLIGTSTFSGSYEKGKKYSFVISTYNCNGKQAGACCKQSDVRTEIQ